MNVSDTRVCAFEAFITNLGKYNEGFLVGEWVKFPVTNEEMQAVLDLGENTGSVQELINLTEKLDCFDYLPGVRNDYDLGCYWIEESGCYDTSNLGALANYIDYEGFGRDIRYEEGGVFGDNGYVRSNGGRFVDIYDGDIVMDLLNTDEDYAGLSDRMDKLKTQYPVIDKMNEGSGEICMTAEEHRAYVDYLNLARQMEDMERQHIYFRGHTDAVAYLKNQSNISTTKAVQRTLRRLFVSKNAKQVEKDAPHKKFF